MILFLAMFALQCGRSQMPVSTQGNHDLSQSSSGKDKDIVLLSKKARDVVGIDTKKVEFRECKSVLSAMGKLLAPQPQKAIVSYAFPARVTDIHIKMGDWVEKGKEQALVTLESYEVGEAKSEFYKAIAERELRKLNLAREERLSKNGIGIEKNRLAAATEYEIAKSNTEAAEKKLHVLGFTEEQVTEIASTHQINPTISLYAPITGKVVEVKAVLGAMVDPSTEILTIIDPRLLWVDAEVYEEDIAKVKVGQEVKIKVPAHPDEVFPGRIIYIGDIVNEETRTITVRAEVSNDRDRLKPGMFADVDIVLSKGRQMPVVPLAAVLEERDEKFVFVQEEEGRFRRQVVKTGDVERVKTGAAQKSYQQILSGLEAGQDVVIQGNYQLYSKRKEEILHWAPHVH